MNEAGLLNARIGRVWPHALADGGAERVPTPGPGGSRSVACVARAAAARCTGALRSGLTRLPRATLPLLLLLLALWPHWLWLARRLTDGSDEPWGWLALATVLALVWKARRELQLPSPGALVVAGALAAAAAALTFIVPPIFSAAAAMLALAVFITSALPQRPVLRVPPAAVAPKRLQCRPKLFPFLRNRSVLSLSARRFLRRRSPESPRSTLPRSRQRASTEWPFSPTGFVWCPHATV